MKVSKPREGTLGTMNLSTLKLQLALTLMLVTPVIPAEALYPFKKIHNASHAIALSPEEWSEEFQCDETEETANETIRTTKPHECNRDKNVWIYKHVDELHDDFKFLVHQRSIDERFADSVYLTNGHTGMDFHHYKFNSGRQEQDELNVKLAAGSEVNNEQCRRHLSLMVDLAADLSLIVQRMRQQNNESHADGEPIRLVERHFRLARVLDSFGRYESGQLGGRYHSYGVYEQCIRTPLQLQDELVGSRYCWAKLNLDRHLSKPLQGLPTGNSSHVVSFFPGDFKFHMAVCLPKSCHSSSFEPSREGRHNLYLVQRLIDSQLKLPQSLYLDESLPLDSVFCLVDPDSKIARVPWGGKLLIALFGIWTSACAFATYRRHLLPDSAQSSNESQPVEAGASFWTHLDLAESWSDFLGEKEISRHGSRVNLDPLNFVKWFCTLLVVISHATVLSGPLTLAHIRLAALMETNRLESLSLFGFVLVDSFFVITGMMIAYIFMKRATALERRQLLCSQQREQLRPIRSSTNATSIRVDTMRIEESGHGDKLAREFSPLGLNFYRACMLLTLTRYLRLVPLFFLAFWFKKTIYPYLGSGPMWDYGLNRDTTIGGCLEETWLTPFTFISAYLPGAKQCLPQTWTISNDIFFSIVMPPVVVLLYKWPKSAFALAMFILTLSLYIGKLTYYQLDASARFEIEQLRDHSVVILFQIASYIYTTPLYRMPAIVVGTLSGYILFKYSCAGTNRRMTVSDCGDEVLENGDCDLERSQTKKDPLYNWPWWFRGPLTYVSLALVVAIFVSSLFTPEFRRFVSLEAKRSTVIYMLLYYHLVWSLANAVLFLRLVSDLSSSRIMRFFASRFFSVAGKLSYAILLIHWDFILFDIHIETQATEFSRWNYLGIMSLAYSAAIPLAIIVFVVIENPLDKLTKTYLLRGQKY